MSGGVGECFALLSLILARSSSLSFLRQRKRARWRNNPRALHALRRKRNKKTRKKKKKRRKERESRSLSLCLSSLEKRNQKVFSPHGHGQLLGVDGARAVGVEEVKGLAEGEFSCGGGGVGGGEREERRVFFLSFGFASSLTRANSRIRSLSPSLPPSLSFARFRSRFSLSLPTNHNHAYRISCFCSSDRPREPAAPPPAAPGARLVVSRRAEATARR